MTTHLQRARARCARIGGGVWPIPAGVGVFDRTIMAAGKTTCHCDIAHMDWSGYQQRLPSVCKRAWTQLSRQRRFPACPIMRPSAPARCMWQAVTPQWRKDALESSGSQKLAARIKSIQDGSRATAIKYPARTNLDWSRHPRFLIRRTSGLEALAPGRLLRTR